MSNDCDAELFDLAVTLVRGGTHYVEIISELEKASRTPVDVRGVISAATTHVETFQAESLAAAVGAARQRMTHFEIAKRLRSLGYQSWDADVLATRSIKKAQDEADAELAKENLDDGLLTLSEKTE